MLEMLMQKRLCGRILLPNLGFLILLSRTMDSSLIARLSGDTMVS